MKPPLAIEKAFTHDPMTMGIPLQKVSRGVDAEDGSTHTSRPLRCPRGKASFMACLRASKAHLKSSFISRLSRRKIPRVALGIEKVKKR